MIRSLFTIVLLTTLSTTVFGQYVYDSENILLNKGRLYVGTTPTSPAKVLDLMKSNQEAYNLMKKAKGSYDFAMGLGYIGGFLVGVPLGSTVAGGDPNWTLAAAGGVTILLALEVIKGFKKNAMRATEIYNSSLSSGGNTPIALEMGMIGNGFGFKVRF